MATIGTGNSPSRLSSLAAALLGLGALAGLAFALIDITKTADRALPPGAVVLVNETIIDTQAYARALSAVEADQRGPVDDAARSFVLSRLIEEELLLQRAEELGLIRSDRRVRNTVSRRMIDIVVADALSEPATEAATRAFYDEWRSRFTIPVRYRVNLRFFASKQALEEGDAARPPRDLPDAPLDALVISRTLGPGLAAAIQQMEEGETSDGVPGPGGFYRITLLERIPARTPPLEEIRADVEQEWRRERADQALETYIRELWREAEIKTAPYAPKIAPALSE